MKESIRKLAQEKNAIILSHNYQPEEIQDIADLCGDSLELSRKAAQTDKDVIVFCGVHFMAETASILSPDKTVLLPHQGAGCPMADMITKEALIQRKKDLPHAAVVTYVNSPAPVKALSTICCTSANAISVVNGIKEDEILMVPDKNLSMYAKANTTKTIHIWEGYCPVHNNLTPEMVEKAKTQHPDAVFMAHPECRPEVLALADAVLSTSGMIRYAEQSGKKHFLVGTEVGILYPLKKKNPDKTFIPVWEGMVCTDMKKITLQDIEECLIHNTGEVRVQEDVRIPALLAVEKMLAVTKT